MSYPRVGEILRRSQELPEGVYEKELGNFALPESQDSRLDAIFPAA